jgi:quinoprotein relay system zinc metallohydrolase 1
MNIPHHCASLALCAAASLCAVTLTATAQTPPATPVARTSPPPLAHMATLDYRLQPRAIAPGVWVIEGAVDDFSRQNGCNIINTGFIATPEGSWVINTGPSFIYGQQQRKAMQAAGVATGAGKVQQVLNLNLHPDYFFGNQAWADVPTRALAGSIAGMQAEGGAYADNLYTLCGDWMKDSASTPARQPIAPGSFNLGQHRLELVRYHGHTADDLVLIDHSSGVVFAGGLVFAERIPTTPHADLPAWLASLDALEAKLNTVALKALVPSHGPVYPDLRGLHQTRYYLRWIDQFLSTSATAGLDMSEVLATPLPQRFRGWAAATTEYARNVTHLYPRYEQKALTR